MPRIDEVPTPPETRRWLEEQAIALGTRNQIERYRADLLPEEELLDLARGELFKPFEGFPRWTKDRRLKPRDVKHDKGCLVAVDGGLEAMADHVRFATTAAGELTGAEYDAYCKISDAVGVALDHPWCKHAKHAVLGFGLVARAHWATCDLCMRESARMSALVSVKWADRVLAREFAL